MRNAKGAPSTMIWGVNQKKRMDSTKPMMDSQLLQTKFSPSIFENNVSDANGIISQIPILKGRVAPSFQLTLLKQQDIKRHQNQD